MANAVEQSAVVPPELAAPPRLRHFYEPWSRWVGGEPRPGAVALCGYVRRPEECDGTVTAGWDSPDVCVVCRDLRGAS